MKKNIPTPQYTAAEQEEATRIYAVGTTMMRISGLTMKLAMLGISEETIAAFTPGLLKLEAEIKKLSNDYQFKHIVNNFKVKEKR
jgi:hypothetical protein